MAEGLHPLGAKQPKSAQLSGLSLVVVTWGVGDVGEVVKDVLGRVKRGPIG